MYLPPRKKKPEQFQPDIEETVYYKPENLPAQDEESLPELRSQEKTRHRGETVQRPRRPVTGWVVLIILVLIPAAFYVMEYLRCNELMTSRDLLFDTYAREVVNRQAPRLFLWTQSNENPVALPDTMFGGWEREFGDDPRYWQLRYCCTKDIPLDVIREYDVAGFPPELYYLEVAREEGKADAATLWILWEQYRDKWLWECKAEIPSEEFKHFSDDKLGLERELIKRHGEEMTILLEEMIAVEPELSWPYYLRARHNYVQGSFDLALADFQRGNSAQDNRRPVPFPISDAIAAAHGNLPVANETLQAGLIKRTELSKIPDVRVWRQMGKEIASAGFGNDREWFAAFHGFACRWGVLQHATEVERYWAGLIAEDLAGGYLVRNAKRLDQETCAMLLELDHTAGMAREYMIRHDYETRLGQGSGLIQLEFDLLSGHRDFGFSRTLRAVSPMLSRHYLDPGSRFEKLFDELAQFDYITISWPEEDDGG